MNRLERIVYNRVRHNPALKKRIRNLYQSAFDLLPTPASKSAYPIVRRPGHFFGFHDHTPFSHGNQRLLSCRFHIPLRMPEPGEELTLGYFDGEEFTDFHPVTTTRAWLWHTGCKLQWRGDSHEMVFNDHENRQNISRVVDSESGEGRAFDAPIATVSPDGRWAIGYDFTRVQRYMPGYGYLQGTDDAELAAKRPRTNGIHRVDLASGELKLLLNLQDMAEIQPDESMLDAWHFCTHAVFSPNSRRFIFLHRWVHEDVEARWSRMLSMDVDGNDIHVFPTTGMVSHIGWRNTDQVIAYCRIPVHDDQYVLFKDGDPENYEVVAPGQFSSDGHPSFDPSGRWMITDTYPDRRRLQSLVLYDMENNARHDLARLHMPRRFQTPRPDCHWACDLHPRWDRKGRHLCFDATFGGERSLCTIDLGDSLTVGPPECITRS
ncbi:hypothetical protein [Wenzhouxiangella sp. EGI_FJ10409]|uniref:hypothetical protein n=1 Tax=Wenzhouxiangella sp. EGI_FJ10409 TaxID=3243767 RepID=UPI0035E32F06